MAISHSEVTRRASEAAFPLRTRTLVSTLVVAAFGPYLSPNIGLRTEQLVVYGLAAVALVYAPSFSLSRDLTGGILTPWTWLVAWLTASTAVAVARGPLPVRLASIAAAIDNYVSPVAIALTVAIFYYRGRSDPCELLRTAAYTLIALLSAHAVLVTAIMPSGIVGWFPLFWGPDALASGASVGHQSMDAGRFVGIFNQPIENGFMHSMGILCIWYLLRVSESGWRRRLLPGALVLVVVGGLVGASKVFTLVGVPMFLGLSLWALIPRRGASTWLAGLATTLAIGGAILTLVPVNTLSRQAGWITAFTSNDPLSVYTAGRHRLTEGLGSGNQLLLQEFHESNSIVGGGLASKTVAPSDNAYLYLLARGGIVGLLLYLAVFGKALQIALMGFRRTAITSPEAVLLLALVSLAFIVGLGAPSLLLNRAGSVYWVLQTACVLVLYVGAKAVGFSGLVHRHSVH